MSLSFIRGDCGDLGDLGFLGNLFAQALDGIDDGGDGFLDTALECHWVMPGGDVLQPFAEDGLREDGCSGGAVSSDIAGFGGDFFHHLRAHVFVRVFEFDFFSRRLRRLS